MRTKPRWGFAEVAVTMACAYCGSDFQSQHRKSINCSRVCIDAWDNLRKGHHPQKLKAHVFDRYITSRVDPPRLNGARFDFLLWQAGATITEEVELPTPRITDRLFETA